MSVLGAGHAENGIGDADIERHQATASKLRAEVEALVQQARVLLHGDAALRQQAPKSGLAKRAERERELEVALEKADWYRREIKRLRRDLEACYDSRNGSGGHGGLGAGACAEERDPMELQNLLVEKRKELQRLRSSGEGLDKIAEVQKRAEAAQNSLSPRIEEKLRRIRNEVEQQKRLNVRLQAERQRVGNARKKADEEVRAAGEKLRSKAAELRRPSRRPSEGAARGDSDSGETKVLKQLRRDMDILKEAVRQDERKFKLALREDSNEVEFASRQVFELRQRVADQEAEVAKLRGELHTVPTSPAQVLLPPEREAALAPPSTEAVPEETSQEDLS